MHVYQVTCPLFCVSYSIESILKIYSIVLQSHTNTRLRRFLPESYKKQKFTLWNNNESVCKLVYINFLDNFRPGSWRWPCIFLVRIFSICSIFSGVLKNHFRKTQKFLYPISSAVKLTALISRQFIFYGLATYGCKLVNMFVAKFCKQLASRTAHLELIANLGLITLLKH